MVAGGPSPSCVSARWVGKNVGWGTDRGLLNYTTTMNDERCSSFGCHIAVGDVAPGLRIRQVSGGR